jgi:5'-methylthioadenosine phosphorylase
MTHTTCLHRRGADLINMTTCPEAALAKELGLLYGAFAMSTDYDAWREGEESVSVAAVLAVIRKNADNTTNAILGVIPKIAAKDWSAEIKAAHDSRFFMGV